MFEKEKNITKRSYKKHKQFSITINRKWKHKRMEKAIDKIMREDKSE